MADRGLLNVWPVVDPVEGIRRNDRFTLERPTGEASRGAWRELDTDCPFDTDAFAEGFARAICKMLTRFETVLLEALAGASGRRRDLRGEPVAVIVMSGTVRWSRMRSGGDSLVSASWNDMF